MFPGPLEPEEMLFEEARKLLLEIAYSKNQVHAGYLIAIVIGTLTLLSRWDSIVYSQTPLAMVPIVFFVILSAISALTVFTIKRMFYWNTYTQALLMITFDEAKEKFKNYINKKEHRKKLEERKNPWVFVLDSAVFHHLEELYENQKVKGLTKFSVWPNDELVALCIGLAALFFIGLLIHYMVLIGAASASNLAG